MGIQVVETLRIIHRYRRKQQSKTIEVTLFEPLSGEQCCIMQESINDCELDFMPNYFRESHKSLTGIKLNCGHCFAVVNILYHWARNDTVQCPVCRQGPERARLNLLVLPKEIKSLIRKRVEDEKSKDVQERLVQDQMVAMQMQSDGTIYDLILENYDGGAFVRVPCLFMQPECYEVSSAHLDILNRFIREKSVYKYRLSIENDNMMYPVTPWAMVGRSMGWIGIITYLVEFQGSKIIKLAMRIP